MINKDGVAGKKSKIKMVFKKLNFKKYFYVFSVSVPLCCKDQAQSVLFTVANLPSLYSTDIKSKS